MTDGTYEPRSALLPYLPAMYQEGEEREQQAKEEIDLPRQNEPRARRPFLDEYLLPFEKILLSGAPEAGAVGIEQRINSLNLIFLPYYAPEEFLPWLASFGAFVLRPDLPPNRKRTLVANIIPLYAARGTRRYLERLLRWTLDEEDVGIDVRDTFPRFQIAAQSTVGVDTFVGGAPPHYFRVTLKFREKTGEEVDYQCELAREVIELAKPAHTSYDLEISRPRMQVGARSTVGVDTYL